MKQNIIDLELMQKGAREIGNEKNDIISKYYRFLSFILIITIVSIGGSYVFSLFSNINIILLLIIMVLQVVVFILSIRYFEKKKSKILRSYENSKEYQQQFLKNLIKGSNNFISSKGKMEADIKEEYQKNFLILKEIMNFIFSKKMKLKCT